MLWHHAHDGGGPRVDADRLANDFAIAAETILPHVVTKNDEALVGDKIFIRRERAARQAPCELPIPSLVQS